MVPDTLNNFFLASAGAGAALVGLIFVAISLWPKEKVVGATPAWRAVAGGSFLSFINAFLVSLSALITGLNLGWSVLALSLIAVSNSLLLGLPLLRSIANWKGVLPTIIANWIMVVLSLAVYAGEGYFGVRLLLAPNDASAVEGVAIVLVLIYTNGLIRAWELLGIEQVGVRRWLNPLQHPAPPAATSDERGERTSSLHDQE